MKNVHKRWSLAMSIFLAAGGGLALATTTPANAAPQLPRACAMAPRSGHIVGIMPAVGVGRRCLSNSSNASDHALGTPPLIFNGGPVMMTPSTSPLVVTPIFWHPSGFSMATGYKSVITTYLKDVAAASGQNSNVYSVLNEYSGNNGKIHYSVKLGTPINDSTALPKNGCTLASKDKTKIYADGSGYSACLDDAQIRAAINRITKAHNRPHNLSHIYVLYLPKHVESCFIAGSTTTKSNACTINHQPSAAFCAYHSEATSNAVYANMPFPIYKSGTGLSCGTNGIFGAIESPNSNPDADTVISPTSHEISEAITDPDTSSGWIDSTGFEIGDECNFVYGTPHGTAGKLFNQTINGHHYLTQEEFSNNDFAITNAGCVQSASAEA